MAKVLLAEDDLFLQRMYAAKLAGGSSALDPHAEALTEAG